MAGKVVVSTLNNDTGVLATQNGMTGIAKAWINCNPTTVTIFGSFNVSSLTRQSTGQYTVNFTTAMPNTTYSSVFGANGSTTGYAGVLTQSTGNITCFGSVAGSFNDLAILNMAVFSS
jgi:hypothetical protein